MQTTLLAIGLLLSISFQVNAQSRRYGLPLGAKIIETQPLTLQGNSDRSLILWMVNPQKHPRGALDDAYTCPEETRGSYYSGPTRISLVDLVSGKIINTVKVRQEYSHGEDTFDIPYKIHAGSYYFVPGVAKGEEGNPKLMQLKDYNGDGKALEFALYDAEACMGLATTLIGYSERQDKVVQYEILLAVKGDEKPKTEVSHWC